MSDIRFNQWLHQSGTGGVSQVDGGHVGIGTTNPDIAVHTANAKKLNVGIVTANSIFAGNFYGNGSNLTGIGDADKIIEGDTKLEVVDAGSAYIVGEVNGTERLRIASDGTLTLTGDINISGEVQIAENIVHTGDGNTSIGFPANDTIRFKTAGTERLSINSSGNATFSGTVETGSELKITGAEPRLTFTDTDNNPDFQIWANAQKFSIYDSTNSATRINIDSSGHVAINTTTEGHGNADDFTISYNNQGVSGGDQGRCGMTIRSGENTSNVMQNGYIYFSDGTSGGNEYRGVVAYSHSDDSMYFSTSGAEKLRIKTDGSIVQTSTKSFQLAKGTTGERPSGVDGMIRFNTTLSQTEEYRDSDWHSLSNKVSVSGGNVTTSGSYTIHTFTSSGTLTVSGSAKSGIEYLVVAGGGGGGGTRAGGGGAGGMLTGSSLTLQPGTYTVTVGAGGAAGTGTNSGGQGGNSVLGTTATAIGGGYGGGQQIQGGSGGSGGGGSDSLSGGAGTSGQGNNGGGSTGSTGGGGGGGKNGVGNQAPGSEDVGGAGGSAGASAISGSTVNYSGGGGGGSRDNAAGGNGGGGGAGRGGRTTGDYATAGSANQGGGGGGGGRHHSGDSAHYNGAAGGSGIVIIRYLT
jgi:hypothetical protein